MIYLASPYSHPLQSVRRARYHAACRAAALCMANGVRVFSPIAHSHPIEATGLFRGGHDWWLPYDLAFLALCSEVWVLRLDGWQDSVGVMAEIEAAGERGIPVRMWTMDGETMQEA